MSVRRLLRRAVHRQHDGDGRRGDRACAAASCGAPAPYEMRDRFNFASGEKIMELIAKNIGRATSSP